MSTPEYETARSLRNSWRRSRLTLGCTILDAALSGGIVPWHVTEISGESGVGKTQLAMQLLLTAQLPRHYGGLEGSTLCITSEYFSFERLDEIATKIQSSSPAFKSLKLTENVFVEKIDKPEQLMHILETKLMYKLGAPLLSLPECSKYYAYVEKARKVITPAGSKPLRLIVIDSIASLYRGADEHSNEKSYHVDRSGFFFQLSQFLRFLSDVYGVAVIVVNQASSSMNEDDPSSHPALGLSWSQCIHTRLWLSKGTSTLVLQGSKSAQPIRKLRVVFSPAVPDSAVDYVITSEGVRGIQQTPVV